MKPSFTVVVLLLSFVTACVGQTTLAGQLQGRVTNAQGAAVPGAKVTATNSEGKAIGQATTAADGSYAIPGLAPGTYSVAVAGGGATLSRQVFVPETGEPVRADFQFTVAAAPTASAEERNPNIFIYRIDLDELRNRLQVARGPDPQYTTDFTADQNFYGAEFGSPIMKFDPLRPRSLAREWRGTAYGSLQNSSLNARNFFNVGPLLPSRASGYDFTGSGPLLSRKATLLLDFGQTFSSGMVNGNVQSPRANERTPTTTDPATFAVISAILAAYPPELPNLPSVSLRQLNANRPRNTKSTDSLGRFDFRASESTAYALRYTVSDYHENPFQLVAGQTPQTDLRSQGFSISVNKTFTPHWNGLFAFYYDRLAADLEPTRSFSDLLQPLGIAVMPDVQFTMGTNSASELANVGPGPQFPRRRTQNSFQYRADLSRVVGRQTLRFGGSVDRIQLNDLQSDNTRGVLTFNADFGRTAVQNFLLGIPSAYTYALGDPYRGFRYWQHALYASDEVRLTPTLTFSIGLRYELMTAPQEINNLTDVNYPTDKNNIAPRAGFAWNPGKGKTVIRAAYGMSYGTLFPATLGVTRFSRPGIQTITVRGPNLDLLSLLNGTARVPSTRSVENLISPDLVLPYSHQYTFSIERSLPWNATARVAYIGMRTFHLFAQEASNRAANVPGVIATTANIDERRPDQNFYGIYSIESAAIAYYDAVQASLDKRISHGLSMRVSYTFGKNIDTGSDFTNNATNLETPGETGESQCELCDHVQDHKGVSLFDTPSSFTLTYSYNLPSPLRGESHAAWVFRGWQISGTTVLQSGTPFHLHTGSDGAGYGNLDGESHDRPNLLNPVVLGKSLDNPDTAPTILAANTCVQPNIPDANGVTAPYERCLYFDTNLTPAGRGDIGFNVLRKDGTANFNFALGRTFPIPGAREATLQFRSEFINLFNHPQFDKPGILLSAATFGKIINTINKGRQIQFSLRANF